MKHALQTKITGRGQTAIPVAVQELIGATPGRSLRWEVRSDGECVVSVVVDDSPDGAMSMLGFAKTFRKARPTASWVRELGGAL